MDTRNAVSKQNNLKISIETSDMVGEYISSKMYKAPKQYERKTKSLKSSVMSDKSPEICHHIEDSENSLEGMSILKL